MSKSSIFGDGLIRDQDGNILGDRNGFEAILGRNNIPASGIMVSDDKKADPNVVLVDDHGYHSFPPSSIKIATASPLRAEEVSKQSNSQ